MITNREYLRKRDVKFVSYTGKYPNLCTGILTISINGVHYSFGEEYEGYKVVRRELPKFWEVDGGAYGKHHGFWIVNCEKLPEMFHEYVYEIDYIMNTEMERPCCGGCI